MAPDYVLVQEDVEEKLLQEMKKNLVNFWGRDPQKSPDYSRIINSRHFQRILSLIPGSGEIIAGGEQDEDDLYIAPTILGNVPQNSPIMSEEIFGPLLPVLKIKHIEEAIAFINNRPKPLALYLFSNLKQHHKLIYEQTSSGSVCINHVLLQLSVPDLPFGGVGLSGMGAYHGKSSFTTFTHYKSILNKPTGLDPALAYPPYPRYLKTVLRWFYS